MARGVVVGSMWNRWHAVAVALVVLALILQPLDARAEESSPIPMPTVQQASNGMTLYVSPGTWPTGTDLAYEWYREDQLVETSSNHFYSPDRETDEGSRFRVVVVGTSVDGAVERRESALSLRVAWHFAPAIKGALRVGATVHVDTSTWTAALQTMVEWRLDGVAIPDEHDPTLVIPAAAEGKVLSAKVTATAPEYPRVVEHSTYSRKTVLRVGTPTISGEAVVGATLTGSPGEWTDGARISASWVVGAKTVSLTDTVLITPEMRGQDIRYVVSGSFGASGSHVTSTNAGVVLSPGSPTVVGAPAVGSTLTLDPGDWVTGTSLSYQWLADGAAIAGARGASFAPTAAQADRRLAVRVVGTMTGRTDQTATSPMTPRVMRVGTVSISGPHSYGSLLTAKPGSWSAGTTFSYQWYVGDERVAGEDGRTFWTGESWIRDKAVRVEVTGSRAGYGSATVSATTKRIAFIPETELFGDPTVGGILGADSSGWRKGTTLSYRWLRDGVVIRGAVRDFYTVRAGDFGRHITARVTATVPGFGTITKTSLSLGKMGRSTTPSVKGALTPGGVVRAEFARWMPDTQYTYQWYRNGGLEPIRGARQKTLRISKSLVGERLSVRVTGRTDGFATASSFSRASARVLASAAPALSGTPVAGRKIVAKATGWTPGARLAYQWHANGKVIPGAKKSTLIIPSSAIGARITVTVTGTKPGYATVVRTSRASSKVTRS